MIKEIVVYSGNVVDEIMSHKLNEYFDLNIESLTFSSMWITSTDVEPPTKDNIVVYYVPFLQHFNFGDRQCTCEVKKPVAIGIITEVDQENMFNVKQKVIRTDVEINKIISSNFCDNLT